MRISGRAMALVLGVSLLAAVWIKLAAGRGRQESVERTRTVPVMGTIATFIVVAPPDSVDLILSHAEQLARQIHDQLDVYGSGPVAELNRTGAAELAQGHLGEIIEISDQLVALTGGCFDPSVGPAVLAWSFGTAPAVPDSAVLDSIVRSHVGWSHLRASPESVWLDPGASLNFGAIAKGYAADRCFNAMVDMGARAALVEIGGEVRCGGDIEPPREWRIGIREPRGDGLLDTLVLTEGAVATSGDYENCIIVDGRRFSHLLDPATGWPEQGIASVTVIGDSCTISDALATAAAVGGPGLVEDLPDSSYSAILIMLLDEEGGLRAWKRGEWPER